MHKFTITKQDNKARLGSYSTAHGDFSTPQFMPVGTRASVKGVDVERLKEVGTQITLVNTYHLWLRPGPEVVKQLGGIHKFCAWKGAILSDSGGYQVFSLRDTLKMSEEGAEFRSHLDGSKCFLTPELSINIQETLGVDIAMVLDECPAAELSKAEIEKSLDLTLRWAKRSLAARRHPETAVFVITQGGRYPDLRKRAAEELAALDCDGIAVGGLSVGESKEIMYETLSYHVQQLPQDKIHYLMGVGTPQDIVEAVRNGIDLFDCVMPTRAGRFGRAFLRSERPYINIKNSEYRLSESALDESCSCVCCRNYSRGYINHLFKVGEMLGPQLVSIHNLQHYMDLMQSIRTNIEQGKYEEFYKDEMARWQNINLSDAPIGNKRS